MLESSDFEIIDRLGRDRCLLITIEELNELQISIMEDNLEGIYEEVNDCIMCLGWLDAMFPTYFNSNSVDSIEECHLNLSYLQHYLSKEIRYGNAESEVVKYVGLVRDSLWYIKNKYSLDYSKLEEYKVSKRRRINDRINEGNLR